MRHRIMFAASLWMMAGTTWAAVDQVPLPAPVQTPPPGANSLQIIPAKQAALLHKIHGFVWGKPTAPAKAIVFVDPNCIWCHRFFEQVQAGVQAGKARYLIVPVAILKPGSMAKAERILQSKDPQAEFLKDETHFNSAQEEGGLPRTFPGASKISRDLVEINTAVLADLEDDKPATPTFVVTTPKGPALHEGFVQHG